LVNHWVNGHARDKLAACRTWVEFASGIKDACAPRELHYLQTIFPDKEQPGSAKLSGVKAQKSDHPLCSQCPMS